MSIENLVKEKYSQVASSTLSGADAAVRSVAEAFGYSAGELDSIPADANMGLSCGNPTATASLRAGEVVVDLGSGGGLDVFLAAQKVGPTGRAIGIDMTPAMIERARRGAALSGLHNCEFHLAPIDRLPLANASADCIISNCVINLAPDKPAVFREMFRVLKPGGRVAVSDIALKQPLPPDLADNLMAYVGCIAGAIALDDYVAGLRAAGFDAVHIVDTGANLNAYAEVEGQSACCAPPMEAARPSALPIAKTGCCGGEAKEPTVHGGLAELVRRYDINDYAASVKVYAAKPLG